MSVMEAGMVGGCDGSWDGGWAIMNQKIIIK